MTDRDNRPPEHSDVRRRGTRRLLLGVAAALVVGTGAGAATVAASGGHEQSSHRATVQQGGHEQRAAVPQRPEQGGLQTFTSQTGTVSSVQEGSISVTGDGGARTYTVDDNTRVAAGSRGLTGIRTGDAVWVVGTPGGSPRALVVVDASRPPLPGMGGAGGGQTPASPTTAPSPTETAPATPTGPGESPETVPPTG